MVSDIINDKSHILFLGGMKKKSGINAVGVCAKCYAFQVWCWEKLLQN